MRVLPDSRRMLGRRSIPRSTADSGLAGLMVVGLADRPHDQGAGSSQPGESNGPILEP